METWKEIKGFDYPYEVSNLGNIRNKGKILRFRNHSAGYNRVSLILDGKSKDKYVHRLVAEHFLSDYSELLVVNHIDGNKKNNSVLNLENVTTQRNTIHAIETGLNKITGENYRLAKLSSSDVEYILQSSEVGIKLAERFNVSPAQVSRIRNGKSRRYEHLTV